MKHAHGITFVLILSYLGSGCLGYLERRVDRLERENIDLRADMESAWANALCSDDVRTLIDSVNQKCQQSLRDAREKEQAGFCLDTDVAMAVLVADPKHQGRFLSLMRSQRSSAAYLALGTTSTFPQ